MAVIKIKNPNYVEGGTESKWISVPLFESGMNPDKMIPVENGGTGANNAVDARINLGLGAAAVKNVATAVNNTEDLVTSSAVKAAIDEIKITWYEGE